MPNRSDFVTSSNPVVPPQLPTPARLLVSVTSSEEAALAQANGADWIDLKNPLAGSLGAPTPATARACMHSLAGHSQASVALGEFIDIDPDSCLALLQYGDQRFPIAKTGLSGVSSREGWYTAFHDLARRILPSRLVPVLYADGQRCGAADRAGIMRLIDSGPPPPYLLIDTFIKDGRRLLDWLSVAELKSIHAELAPYGTQLVLAGSLQLEDLPSLLPINPAAIAVRGAVCQGDRTGALSSDRVRQWSQRLQAQRMSVPQ